MRNQKTAAVREFIRQPFAFPGGYPLVLVMSDGGTLCARCARDNYRLISHATRHDTRDGWKAEGAHIHWEGGPECCDHCGAETESAYGEED